MNTRPQEGLAYRELATQQARISRQIAVRELTRLTPLVAEADATALDVDLAFSLDRNGHAQVVGGVRGSIRLVCNGCAELLSHPLDLRIDCVIVASEQLASEIAAGTGTEPGRDVLIADGNEIGLAEIVEDEVFLSLPERLCAVEPCQYAPRLDYPADDQGLEQEQTTARPFDVLAGLNVSKDKELEQNERSSES